MTSRVATLHLSPDLCNLIVAFAHPRSLCSLALTCKLFRRPAQARIFQQLTLTDVYRAADVCASIIKNDQLGTFVQSFIFFFEPRNSSHIPVRVTAKIWNTIADALRCMPNVQNILISDHTYSHTAALESLTSARVFEARLRLAWDSKATAFLASQENLELLQFYTDEYEHILARGDTPPSYKRFLGDPVEQFLPAVRTLDTNFAIAEELFAHGPDDQMPLPNLKRLQIIYTMKDNTQTHPYLEKLPKMLEGRQKLVSLSLPDLQEGQVIKTMSFIARVLPNLKHIGVLPLPLHQRHLLWSSLLRLRSLVSMEIDLTRWVPSPLGPAQRAIACELHVYAPLLRRVVFCLGTQRWVWVLEGLDGGEVKGDAEGRWLFVGPAGHANDSSWSHV
ncbi:hypothetical protein HGRIS_005528 [Hohenbuehelia grisea]|uniref:F-box domain-containing protein n=1 Tax=Hohenbuehelia grisea TaxID=104357 RepID=A0ABR3JY43_9AGAR